MDHREPPPLPEWSSARSIPARLQALARQQRDRIAIREGDRALTYGELGASVERLAGAVLALDPGPDRPIVVALPHGLDALVVFLGVLAAGLVAAPVDPTDPAPRLGALLADTFAAIALTDASRVAGVRAAAPPDRPAVDVVDVGALPAPRAVPDAERLSPDAPAFIGYTSGSTGAPKGIVYSHRMMLHNAACYAEGYGLTADDRLTMLHTLAFTSGQAEALVALMAGAALHILDPRRASPVRIAEWLDADAITVYNHFPSAFRLLAPVVAARQPPHALRVVALGSEPVHATDVALFQRTFAPPCRLVVRFGSSEVGNIALWHADHRTALEDDVVPAGRIRPGREVILLDESGRPTAPGEAGQIAVRSRYMALGYWRQPELTAAVFLPGPEGADERTFLMGDLGRWRSDGSLVHLGRRDAMVKIRGQRVDLATVERVLLALPGVADAVVLAVPRPDGEQRLVAWVVPRDGAGAAGPELAAAVRESLPETMVPSAFVPLRALPRTPSGKVDRRGLPAPAVERPPLTTAFAEPRTPVEREVAAIWAEALALAPVGIDDDFLELGGHSLTAARVAASIEGALGVRLGPHELLVSPTVRTMVAVVLARRAAALPQAEAERLLRDVEPRRG